MNFLIFRDFSRIFQIYFRFKTIKKGLKRGFIFARDPLGCLRRAEVTRGHYLYLVVIDRVIVHISLPIIER